MASKTLFKSHPGRQLPKADTVNKAGGIAYKMPPKHALAQYAATGCLGHTYYASADEQLATVLKLCEALPPEFIARTAIYARTRGYMKDLPALLLAVLAAKPMAGGLLAEAFDKVVDDARMLRNFVQIVRSGVTGRKSLGSLPKRLVAQWFDRRTDDQVFRASVGNDPSLADVVKMVHPRPATVSRKALYGYLIGRPHDAAALPPLVRQFEAFKTAAGSKADGVVPAGKSAATGQAVPAVDVPNVPFQMLTALPLTSAHWKAIAWGAPWQMTRMNLNTFARHGVFEGPGGEALTRSVAERLRDPEQIAKAKVFPYQLMVAYSQCDAGVPAAVRDALQDAMEVAIANVPTVPNGVWVFPDVSGSMHSPVTGSRPGATSVVRCVDVAALVAAAMLRRNPGTANVLPFQSVAVTSCHLNPRDSVMTNAKTLAGLPSGGTNCSAPLAELNRRKAKGDLLVYVSDNESWVDSPHYGVWGGGRTQTMAEWAVYKVRNPAAKLVCIDIQPNATTQANERADILNVGGFSDRVFDVIAEFAAGTLRPDHWVGVIEGISL